MLVHIRQPFHSIASATVFTLLGLLFSYAATNTAILLVGMLVITSSALWAAAGVMFLMAYFALVHLKYRD